MQQKGQGYTGIGPEAPTSETERLLVGLWARAFGQTAIAATDNFFALGGDSLIAAAIGSGIEAETGLKVSFQIFFDQPVLKDMAKAIDELLTAEGTGAADEMPLEVLSPDTPIPISITQYWPWWVLSQDLKSVESGTFALIFRIDGPLNNEALEAAISFLIARHEMLRTWFRPVQNDVLQIVEPPFAVEMQFTDLAEAEHTEISRGDILRTAAQPVRNLKNLPLFHCHLVRTAPQIHKLVISIHHILFDDVSLDLLLEEIAQAYAAFALGSEPTLPPLKYRYAEYAYWQRQNWRTDSDRFKAALSWWRERVAGRPHIPDFRALRRYGRRQSDDPATGMREIIRTDLDPAISEGLDGLSREQSATPYSIRVAALAGFMANALGADRVAIGSMVTDRYRSGLDGVFGPFAQDIPIIVDVDFSRRFRDLIGEVRDQLIKIRAFTQAPFLQIRQALRTSNVNIPIPPITVNTTSPPDPQRAGDMVFSLEDISNAMPSQALWINFALQEDHEYFRLRFNPRVFSTGALRQMTNEFTAFLSAASQHPDQPLNQLLAMH